ncbi:MAG: hypothetical protein H6707_18280 [Deltaproteobacteria bacterium]|nr:hypothetical protein [Deltaproteobacteria bacterium]
MSCARYIEFARLLSDDLDAERAASLRSHIESCERCRSQFAAISANVEDYQRIAETKRLQLVERIAFQRVEKRPTRARSLLWWGPLITASAATALLLVLRLSLTPSASINPQTAVRFKGGLALQVIAKRGDRQFVVDDGARLYSGDALRFVATVDRPGQLAIVSLDAARRLSWFYPQRIDAPPVTLGRAGSHTLSGSVILDDSRGKELLIAVFSPQPLDLRRLSHMIDDWARSESLTRKPPKHWVVRRVEKGGGRTQ